MGEGGNTVGDSPVETSLERVEALLEVPNSLFQSVLIVH